MAGHVLAATGLCMATSPDAQPPVYATGSACDEHVPADTGGGAITKHHCPGEEPTPQARMADLPAPQPLALPPAAGIQVVGPVADRLVQAVPDHAVPPPPLYARLRQRLRL